MSIEVNYDSRVDVQRLTPIDSTEKETYDDYLFDVLCNIQPLDDQFTQDVSGSFGKESLMFCDAQDILEGDKIINKKTGINYKVVAVENFDFLGQIRHMELRIRRFID